MDVMGVLAGFTARFFDSPDIEKTDSLLRRFKKSGGYLALNKVVGFAIPFAARAGFEVVELKRGYLKAKMPFKGNTNHINSMYAGALFTLAEIPGGVMAIFEFGSGYYPVLKEMNIRYMAPVKTDATVEFRLSREEISDILKRTEENGKADFTLNGKIYDSGGDLVAETVNYYQLRKKVQEKPQQGEQAG